MTVTAVCPDRVGHLTPAVVYESQLERLFGKRLTFRGSQTKIMGITIIERPGPSWSSDRMFHQK